MSDAQKVIDAIKEATEKLGPAVTDAFIQAAWIDALSFLLTGLFLLVVIVPLIFWGLSSFMKDKDGKTASDGEVAVVLVGLSMMFIIGCIGLFMVSNAKSWHGLFNPKAYLAGKILKKVEKN